MSSGLSDTSEFGADVPSSSPPFTWPGRFTPVTSIGLKFVVEKVVLFIGTPSTMNSGWLDPLIVRSPRIWIAEPAPGSPDVAATWTLGALPASAWTIFDSLDFTMRSGDDDFAELQRIRLEVEVLHEVGGAERDTRGLWLVADASSGQRHGLAGD